MFKLKTEITSPIAIDIKSDDSTPSFQQALVIQQYYHLLEMLRQANEALEQKSLSILQASGVMATLVGTVGLVNLSTIRRFPDLQIGLGIVFAGFALMVMFTILTIWPHDKSGPGGLEWPRIKATMLDQPPDNSFEQLMANLLDACKSALKHNHRKGRLVVWNCLALLVQVSGIGYVFLMNLLRH